LLSTLRVVQGTVSNLPSDSPYIHFDLVALPESVLSLSLLTHFSVYPTPRPTSKDDLRLNLDSADLGLFFTSYADTTSSLAFLIKVK